MNTSYAVFCGIDVGKGEHHAVGLDASGDRLYDKPLPNDEMKLRAVFDDLARYGPVLVIVDQPNTIGALPVTVARACGHDVAYLPGLSMRRIADLYPGQAKTDARDAFIIADTARAMPHTLRRVDTGDEVLAELGVLVGFDDDLAGEATRISNRIRGLLTGIHPALERVVGPRISHPAVLEILTRCGGPNGIRVAGKRKNARASESTRTNSGRCSTRPIHRCCHRRAPSRGGYPGLWCPQFPLVVRFHRIRASASIPSPLKMALPSDFRELSRRRGSASATRSSAGERDGPNREAWGRCPPVRSRARLLVSRPTQKCTTVFGGGPIPDRVPQPLHR